MIPKRDPGGPGLSAAQAYADRMAGGAPREVFSPGRAAVDEVRVYSQGDPPGWLLVTLGLSDLDFELTVRLDRKGDDVPTWAVDLLLSLGAYCRHSHRGFTAGDHIDLRGPIKLDSDTAITAAVVTADPTLKKLGQVAFLRVVGLTADELELCRSWQTSSVISLLRQRDPQLTTVLDRPSLLEDPAMRAAAEAGVASDGSALDSLRVGSLTWKRRRRVLVVTMGAGAATALGPALRRKLSHQGAEFAVVGDAGELLVRVTEADAWHVDGESVVIEVGLASVEALADLFDGKIGSGTLATLSGLRFSVIP